MKRTIVTLSLLSACILLTGGCGTDGNEIGMHQPGTPLERTGDEIMVCGKLYHTGAPVVLWTDPGGYDAYRIHCKFKPDQMMPSHPVDKSSPMRFSPIRRNVPEDVQEEIFLNNWDLETLQEYVDLFVYHYDVCGTSKNCFRVLQDSRGLSVHFMLDLDGTIYQTLDLKERAWHAGSANCRSVGIEIANMGAYGSPEAIPDWYGEDEEGNLIVKIPESMGDGGIRTPDFVAYPATNEIVSGPVQGKTLYQYDFTPEQYDSLVKLTATLCKIFPKMKCDYPRDENGDLITVTLSKDEMANFHGLLGHWHITKVKVDPGPAFDWDTIVEGAQEYLGE